MNPAEVLAPEISEPLMWAEICARYPDEWVCLAEIEFVHSNGVEIRAARVIGHGETRRAPVEQAMHWRERYEVIGHFFTGRVTVPPIRPAVILNDEIRDAFRDER